MRGEAWQAALVRPLRRAGGFEVIDHPHIQWTMVRVGASGASASEALCTTMRAVPDEVREHVRLGLGCILHEDAR